MEITACYVVFYISIAVIYINVALNAKVSQSSYSMILMTQAENKLRYCLKVAKSLTSNS